MVTKNLIRPTDKTGAILNPCLRERHSFAYSVRFERPVPLTLQ